MPKSGLGLQNSKLLMLSGLSTTSGDAQVEHSSRFVERSVNNKHTLFSWFLFLQYFQCVTAHFISNKKYTSKCVQPKFTLRNPFRRDTRFDFHFLPGFCKSLVDIGSTHAPSLIKQGYHPCFPSRVLEMFPGELESLSRDSWF